MGFPIYGSLMASLLASACVAQNNTNLTCSVLGGLINYNASTSHSMPALYTTKDIYLGDDSFPDPRQSFKLMVDPSQNWSVSLRISQSQQFPRDGNKPELRHHQSVLLDTADSNVTHMTACHSFVQAHDPDLGYRWTKDVLERSLEDKGDCKNMLGDDCVNALARHYRQEAFANQTRSQDCGMANSTMPAECAGMLQPYRSQMNLTYDLLEGGNIQLQWNTTDQPSSCGDLNTTSNHGFVATSGVAYDENIRFPVVDVITFFPDYYARRPLNFYTDPNSDIHVEVMCLRPDQIETGSRTPVSGEDLLGREDAKFVQAADEGKSSEDGNSSSASINRPSSVISLLWICTVYAVEMVLS